MATVTTPEPAPNREMAPPGLTYASASPELSNPMGALQSPLESRAGIHLTACRELDTPVRRRWQFRGARKSRKPRRTATV